MFRRIVVTLVLAAMAFPVGIPAAGADPLPEDECILKPVWC